MKKILSLALILAMLFSFAACVPSTPPQTPSAPANIAISDSGLITWDNVDGAEGYIVVIDGKNNIVDDNFYQVQSVEKTFTYSVITIGKNAMSEPSETYTFQGKGPIITPPDLSGVTVAVSGGNEIKSGKTLQLQAVVGGTDNTAVTWTVLKGGNVISVDSNGLVTAQEVDGDVIAEVEARSVANDKKFATKTVTVVAKSVLTQDMLDALRAPKISCDGFVEINVYTIGLFSKLESTSSMIVSTRMDGTNWYSEYTNSIGTNSRLYCTNHDGLASLVGLSYENSEMYEPMLDDNGQTISWEKSGLYNNFNVDGGLKVSDFTFNEDTWRYEYSGSDATLAERMVASANPYDFKVNGFSLIIADGAVAGIHAVSDDDYSIVAKYRCVQILTVAITVDEDLEVPSIAKYSHEDIHDTLNTAIQNMKDLTSYTTDVKITNYSILSSSSSQEGYVETVTPDVCYFVPYTISYAQDTTEIHTANDNHSYGYYKVNDALYNSFYNNGEGAMLANRAYSDSFSNARPTFAFAGEIFRSYFEDSEKGEVQFQVESNMTQVATTLYKSIGNDNALYGIFASDIVNLWGYQVPATYLTVKDGYITEVVFWYDMYYMYGYVEISFDNFNTATLPESLSFDSYQVRQVPTQWNQLETELVVNEETNETEIVDVENYLTTTLGTTEIPFFGEALGDTYGFVMQASHISSNNKAHMAALFYYDVPLDNDYTIESSLKTLDVYLQAQGFAKNAAGEYHKGNIWICPVDQDLDLIIYVWTE